MNGDFRIGPWLVEPTLNRISRNGASRHLEPKFMAVLVCLAKAGGQVVPKQQLIDEVWKDTFVTDDVLTRSISGLRDAFGDHAHDPAIIQTIPKQGYRLLLAVSAPERPGWARDKRGLKFLHWALVAMALVTLAGLVAFRHSRRSTAEGTSSSLKVTQLTHSGHAGNVEVTPDGKSLYYIKIEQGRNSIWLRQIGTGSETLVLAPSERQLYSVQPSVDGEYLYFTESSTEFGMPGARGGAPSLDLYLMPALGGSARRIATSIESSLALSPDGNKIAFLRNSAKEGTWDVIVANTDGTDEQVVYRRHEPGHYVPGQKLAWSPDGRSIAAPGRHMKKGEVAIIDVISRTERVIPTQPWEGAVCDMAWLPDRSGIVLQGFVDERSQLWFLDLVSQTARRITRDTANYWTVALTHGGQDIVTVQSQMSMTIWTADYSSPMRVRQVTFSPRASDGELGVSWTTDKRILYGSLESGNDDIWLLDPATGSKQRLTTDPVRDLYPRGSPDARYIAFQKFGGNSSDIWRMDADGRNPVLLTDTATNYWPRMSPDGKTVIFVSSRGGKQRIWKVPLGGGKAEMVADIEPRDSDSVFLSPDGKWIGVFSTEAGPGQTVIINAKTGAQVKTVEGKHSAFTPDNNGLLFFADYKGVRNIFARPLAGGKPYPLTTFLDKGVLNFDVSPDGKKLALVRGESETDIVLISGFRERNSP